VTLSPSATSQFLEREFLQDDPVKFARLAGRRSPVDSLVMATRGELSRSARYRELLAPMDLGDERVVRLSWSCRATLMDLPILRLR